MQFSSAHFLPVVLPVQKEAEWDPCQAKRRGEQTGLCILAAAFFSGSSSWWTAGVRLGCYLKMVPELLTCTHPRVLSSPTKKNQQYRTVIYTYHYFSRILHFLFGDFLKWGYPQIIHLNRIFHYKPFILGYPHFSKPRFLFFGGVAIYQGPAKSQQARGDLWGASGGEKWVTSLPRCRVILPSKVKEYWPYLMDLNGVLYIYICIYKPTYDYGASPFHEKKHMNSWTWGIV